MAWEDILKRRKMNDPRKDKKVKDRLTPEQKRKFYGGRNYAKEAEEAKKRREAILGSPETKEKVRKTRLRNLAETEITRRKRQIENIKDEVKFFSQEYLPKFTDSAIEETLREVDESDRKDIANTLKDRKDGIMDSLYDLLKDEETAKERIDFLERAIKSDFKGLTEYDLENPLRGGSSAQIESEAKIDTRARKTFNKIMRELGFEDEM
tara:strand:- start:74 stop:700 length:627 start_codon:yes stop_codon:yes gene_type:complete